LEEGEKPVKDNRRITGKNHLRNWRGTQKVPPGTLKLSDEKGRKRRQEKEESIAAGKRAVLHAHLMQKKEKTQYVRKSWQRMASHFSEASGIE